MPTANLTTKEVARLLHISEATVKRWADDGLLHSEKTVGGHRRFGIQAIARLRREQGLAVDTKSTLRRSAKRTPTKPLLSPASFAGLILRGDEAEATGALIDAYLHQNSLASLFDTTITQAMHKIGEQWFQGAITIADEHLATRVVLNALQKLRAIIVPTDPTGLRAICCGIEGDLHELPIHLVEMILESQGWEVVNLGPNMPLFSLRDMMTQKRPHLVCISARTLPDLDRAVAEYERLRRVASKLDAAVVVGGEAFRDPNLHIRLPAEFHAEDFKTFSNFVRRLARKKN